MAAVARSLPSRQIVVGDVHGCLPELELLIDRVQPTSEDELVFLGDLLDKGIHSVGVVRFVRNLSERVRVVLIEGNHEEKHRRWRRGAGTKLVGAAEIEQIESTLSVGEQEFLENAKLWHPLAHRHGLIVHGGISPTLEQLPDEHAVPSTQHGKAKRLAQKLQRFRYISTSGDFLHPDLAGAHALLWAERYDGRFGTVVFGHHPFLNATMPVRFANAIGIDLGCVYGGYLCALIGSDGDHKHEVVRSVQANN